jgi:hypothetical protein
LNFVNLVNSGFSMPGYTVALPTSDAQGQLQALLRFLLQHGLTHCKQSLSLKTCFSPAARFLHACLKHGRLLLKRSGPESEEAC